MLVSNLSTDNSPCWLIQTNEITLMLDFPLSYWPLYQNRFVGKANQVPRFKTPDLDRVADLTGVDAIIISNYQSFMGLPWLTESGKVHFLGKALSDRMSLFQKIAKILNENSEPQE